MNKYNYITFLLMFLYAIPAYCMVLPNRPNRYVQLAPPDNITTFQLDTSQSNAGWKNLRLCIYNSAEQSVSCLPDSEQNVMVYKRSNLTETTSSIPPKRSPADTAVLIGTYERHMKLNPKSDELTPVTFYVWKMKYENPQ